MAESRDVKQDRVTGQRQRVDQSIEIRKQKRMDALKKRRKDSGQTSLTSLTSLTNMVGSDQTDQTIFANLHRYVQMVNQSDDAVLLKGVRSIRKMLSNVDQVNAIAAQAVVQTNIVPRLVHLLKRIDNPGLQYEVIWALTNIASTNLTDCLAVDQPPSKCNALPIVVQLMRSPNPDVRDQCCWCVGNVAGDGAKLRDTILAVPNSMTNLLLNITKASSENALENAVWALANMCRFKPKPDKSVWLPTVPVLAKLILLENKRVLADTCWALSYLSDGDDEDIQHLVDVVPTKRLVDLAGHADTQVVAAALRFIGNIISGTDSQAQALIDTGGLFARMFRLLDHPKKSIQKETCWTLSNIAAGTTSQARQLAHYVEAGESIVGKVIQLGLAADFGVKKEACWMLANLCTRNDQVCIAKVVGSQPSGLDALCQALLMTDETVVLACLEAIQSILEHHIPKLPDAAGPGEKSVEELIEQYGGLENLEVLQESANEKIYLKAAHIVESYINNDQGEDTDDDAPGFTFA